MDDDDTDSSDIDRWDPAFVKRAMGVLRPVAKHYFRSEVRGLERMPPGGALLVSNHSGGLFPVDTPVFALDFYDAFGYSRPVYTLSHDFILAGPIGDVFSRLGFIRANRANAARALRSGAVVIVFPGGEHDVYRPTRQQNRIDFHGRTGYVATALQAGVPIVPVVSIGGQENQLYLSRGGWLARTLRLNKLTRAATFLPISFGFPFGLSAVVPINLPLPTKIVTQVLDPIDITTEFGRDPDQTAVDARVRAVMQDGIDRLAARRRLPVVG